MTHDRARAVTRVAAIGAIASLLLFQPTARGQTGDEPLTLEGAISIALAGSRHIEIATLEVAKAEERLTATKTHRYPVLDLDVMASKLLSPIEMGFERGVFGDFPGIGPIPDEDTQVTSESNIDWFVTASVAQPLTQQREIGLGVEAAQMDVEVRRERLRLARQEVASQVRQAYDAVLQAQSARDAAVEASAYLTELERVVAGHVERETALTSDLLDVRARLLGSGYQQRVAEHSAQTAKEQLNLLLGRDVTTPFTAQQEPAPPDLETNLEAAVAKALESRPDVREARLLARTADLDLSRKRAEYIPDLSFVISNYSLNVDFLPRNIQTVGLNLSWEPFDWGRKRHEAAEKLLTRSQSERSAAETEAAARVEVGSLFRALDESRALIEVREAERTAAKEKARVLANRYEQQAALLKDVLQAQSDVAQTEDRYRQSVLAYWTTRAGFLKAVGEE
ncbi:MAG TPA: TolC family protein [Candidatus Polarisedimenticolia bacterium]|nr:TolC family protein [Candidatus Polarisedimenticolia bacterium]